MNGEDVEEGPVRCWVPKGVFFSPLQALQRDLSVIAVSVFAKQRRQQGALRVVDALAGSGIRALRYAAACGDDMADIVANDLNREASASIAANAEANGLEGLCSVRCGDARSLLMDNPGAFDVVELDPCGSPAPYLSAAVRATKAGGLLLVACTDFKDLTGGSALGIARSWARYGATPLPGLSSAPEFALRAVLLALHRAAAVEQRQIRPLLCFSRSFFLRLIVRVEGPEDHDREASPPEPPLLVWRQSVCPGLHSHVSSLGGDVHLGDSPSATGKDGSGGQAELGGPIWAGPCCDADFLQHMVRMVCEVESLPSLSSLEDQSLEDQASQGGGTMGGTMGGTGRGEEQQRG